MISLQEMGRFMARAFRSSRLSPCVEEPPEEDAAATAAAAAAAAAAFFFRRPVGADEAAEVPEVLTAAGTAVAAAAADAERWYGLTRPAAASW